MDCISSPTLRRAAAHPMFHRVLGCLKDQGDLINQCHPDYVVSDLSDKDPLFIHLISAVIVSEVILPEALSSSLSNHYPIPPIMNQTHGFTASVARSPHVILIRNAGILNIPGQAKRLAKTFVHKYFKSF